MSLLWPLPSLSAYLLVFQTAFSIVQTIYLQGTQSSYIRYPKWNGCANASISFDFRTTQREGILLYVDDGGLREFIEISHGQGRVTVLLKVVKDGESYVDITLGRDVNDGRWHRVELRRKIMQTGQTTLIVDGESRSQYSFGADYQFGAVNLDNNSYTYIGGLPQWYSLNLQSLSLPSAAFRQHFNGYLRNVMYGNCTCQRLRVRPIDGSGFTRDPEEICDISNNCSKGCLCFSEDDDMGVPKEGASSLGGGAMERRRGRARCDCSDKHCLADVVVHYRLPMDTHEGNMIVNPSELKAYIRPGSSSPGNVRRGSPASGERGGGMDLGEEKLFEPGVDGRGIRLGSWYISIVGMDHRSECFGDLDLCRMGYSLSVWIKLSASCIVRVPSSEGREDVKTVLLSNGGHERRSHGVSLVYHHGRREGGGLLEATFRQKIGREWKTNATGLVTGRWYHVCASWLPARGLHLYIDGAMASHDQGQMPLKSGPTTGTSEPATEAEDEFCLGRSCPIISTAVTAEAKEMFDGKEDREIGRDMEGNQVRGRDITEEGVAGFCEVVLDEFEFWSKYLDANEVRELGPIFCYTISMDDDVIRHSSRSSSGKSGQDGATSTDNNGDPMLLGRARSIDGWLGRAVMLEAGGYVDAGSTVDTCVGDLLKCRHGVTVSLWLRCLTLVNNTHLLSTGRKGIKIQYVNGRLLFSAQKGWRYWSLDWNGLVLRTWLYLEISWSSSEGLSVYVDQSLVASTKIFTQLDTSTSILSTVQPPSPDRGMDTRFSEKGGMERKTGEDIKNQTTVITERLLVGKANEGLVSDTGANFNRVSSTSSTDKSGNLADGEKDGTTWHNDQEKFVVDELEVCYGHRKQLLRLDVIQRDRPKKYTIDMDLVQEGQLIQPASSRLDVYAAGSPLPVPGKINNATRLDGTGTQWLDIQEKPPGTDAGTCLTSLIHCRHGMTVTMWAKFREHLEGMYYLSSGAGAGVWGKAGGAGFSGQGQTGQGQTGNGPGQDRVGSGCGHGSPASFNVFYNDSRLVSEYRLPGQVGGAWVTWRALATAPPTDVWTFLEFSWHPTRGAKIFVNSQLKSEAVYSEQTTSWEASRINGAEVENVDKRNCPIHNVSSKLRIGYVVDGVPVTPSNGGSNTAMTSFRTGNFLVDETEVWYSDRDSLLAFDYIARGNITHLLIKFDQQRGNEVVLPRPSSLPTSTKGDPSDPSLDIPTEIPVTVWLHGEATLEKGKVGNALSLRRVGDAASLIPRGSGVGREFKDTKFWCAGNVDHCQHGLLISLLLRCRHLIDGARYITSRHYALFGCADRLCVRFHVHGLIWEVTSSIVKTNTWYQLDISWDMDRGLELYIDKRLAERRSRPIARHRRVAPVGRNWEESIDRYMSNVEDHQVFFGAVLATVHNSDVSSISSVVEMTKIVTGSDVITSNVMKSFNSSVTRRMDGAPELAAADALIDETEFWFANRDHVKAFGLAEDDISGVIFDMERIIDNDRLYHQTHVVYTFYSPQIVESIHGKGVQLNGLNQYMDAGKDIACKENIVNCPKGFTLRLKLKTLQLANNMYFVSSAPIDLFYRDGRLVSVVRTANKEWTVSTPHVTPRAWNQIDVSWHPTEGLELFVNGSRVFTDTQAVTNEADYNPMNRFYIGRANTNMVRESYAHAIFDDVEVWEATRDTLIKLGHIDLALASPRRQSKPTVKRRVQSTTPATTMRRGNPWWAEPTTNRPITRGYYIQIPTGRPIKGTTLSRRASEAKDLLPTLPPRFKKQLVFDGNSYIEYNVGQFPDEYRGVNDFEQIHIRLRTEVPSGLLWFSGTPSRHLHLSIKNGALLLVITYDDYNVTEKFKVDSSTRLDDNEWHTIYITRAERHLTLTVDGQESPKTLLDSFDLIPFPIRRGRALPPQQRETTLSGVVREAHPALADTVGSGMIYLAGSDRTMDLTNQHMKNNFRGTLDKVIFSGDSLPTDMNLLDLTLMKPTLPYVGIYGNVQSLEAGVDNETITEPGAVTFTREQSYLRLPLWGALYRGSIEFYLKTVEPDGLVLYNGGRSQYRDFFAVEIYDGIPAVVIDLGDGAHRFTFGEGRKRIDDGATHFLRIERNHKLLNLTLDKESYPQNIVSGDTSLNLGTFMFLGAVDNYHRLPWHLWTRKPKFYMGCIWSMKVNDGELVDLPTYAVDQEMLGVELGCKTKPLECLHVPCVNGATCVDRWSGYRCLCMETPFTGKMCHLHAPMMAFLGSEFVEVSFRPMLSTHTDDVTLRFKTVSERGLLFLTSNQGASDYLKAFMDLGGKVKLETNFGGQANSFQMTLRSDHPLNDSQWHTLHVQRRANYLCGWVDSYPRVTADSPGEGYTLDADRLYIARTGRSAPFDQSFVGHMQNFVYNDYNIFEALNSSDVLPGITINRNFTGNLTRSEKPIPVNPVTLRTRSGSYLSLPALNASSNFSLRFMFRTKQDGLLFYNAGITPDFISLELINGSLRLLVIKGHANQSLLVHASNSLTDGEWHIVSVAQLSAKTFNVSVNEQTSVGVTLPTHPKNTLDLLPPLYFGGIPSELLPSGESVSSATAPMKWDNFAGCLASLNVGTTFYNLGSESLRAGGEANAVVLGCTDVEEYCTSTRCQHSGVCRELVNSFVCDCNLTTYVGKTCSEEAEGYLFNPGIASLSLDSPVETYIDKVAFGFMTGNPNSTLLRMDSGLDTDFIEVRLQDGRVIIVYSVGDNVQLNISDSSQMYNDSAYHSLVFLRTGFDSTLSIDDRLVNATNFTHLSDDSANAWFNEMTYVTMGGNVDSDGMIINPFYGIIAGLYINGHRVIESVVHGSQELSMSPNDVSVANHPFKLPPKKFDTNASLLPTVQSSGNSDSDDPLQFIEITPGEESETDLSHTAGDPFDDDHVLRHIPSEFGGGGLGSKMALETDDGMTVLVQPGNRGGSGLILGMAVLGAASDTEGASDSGRFSHSSSVNVDQGVIRAGAVAGTMLGLLAAAMSAVWALYGYKPGIWTSGPSRSGFRGGRTAPDPLNQLQQQSVVDGLVTANGVNKAASLGAATTSKVLSETKRVSQVTQTVLTAVSTAGNLPPAEFSVNYGTTVGSGIAGLESIGNCVHRGTQTMMIYTGLGEDGAWRGNASDVDENNTDEEEDDDNNGGETFAKRSARRQSVYHAIEEWSTTATTKTDAAHHLSTAIHSQLGSSEAQPTLATAQTQTPRSHRRRDYLSVAGYTSSGGGDESLSSTSISYNGANDDTDKIVHKKRKNGNQRQRTSQPNEAGFVNCAIGELNATIMDVKPGFGGLARPPPSLSPNSSRGLSTDSSPARTISPDTYRLLSIAASGLVGSAPPRAFDERSEAEPEDEDDKLSMTQMATHVKRVSRVSCVLVTRDGQYVVTSSRNGPPQVWDVATDELSRVMGGDFFGCADLHLAAADGLLVGQVTCPNQSPPSDVGWGEFGGTSDAQDGTLQIWDFESGQALVMSPNVPLFSASSLLHKTQSIAVAHLNSNPPLSGDTAARVTVTVWDLLGNEQQLTIQHRLVGTSGLDCKLQYVSLTADNSLLITGVQNIRDNIAQFLIWDLRLTSEPVCSVLLNANVLTTAILPDVDYKYEGRVYGKEAVTGLHDGQLVAWSLTTGKVVRRVGAHEVEVRALAMSRDGAYLVSASVDMKLYVWALNRTSSSPGSAPEQLIHTLIGHAAEVTCCTFSSDSSLIGSASRDNTIRLWSTRSGAEVCAFNAGVDVFTVQISDNKRTVVALGDRYATPRKLIILQIVREARLLPRF